MAASSKDDTEDLKEQFETLRNDVNTLVSSLSKTASKSANRTAEELSEEVSRIAGDLRAKGKRAYSDTEDAIVSNPIQSLLIALGVGFLIGALTRR